jgi:hypothetical protein
MPNSFQQIEAEGEKAPAYLKTQLVAEIDTIRNSMELVKLFVSHFFDAAGTMVSFRGDNSTTDSNQNPIS